MEIIVIFSGVIFEIVSRAHIHSVVHVIYVVSSEPKTDTSIVSCR